MNPFIKTVGYVIAIIVLLIAIMGLYFTLTATPDYIDYYMAETEGISID